MLLIIWMKIALIEVGLGLRMAPGSASVIGLLRWRSGGHCCVVLRGSEPAVPTIFGSESRQGAGPRKLRCLCRGSGRVGLMPVERDNSKLVAPCLYLVAGLLQLSVALLDVLTVHHLPEYRGGIHSRGVQLLLHSTAGFSFLIGAAFGFRAWYKPKPEVKRTALWSRL